MLHSNIALRCVLGLSSCRTGSVRIMRGSCCNIIQTSLDAWLNGSCLLVEYPEKGLMGRRLPPVWPLADAMHAHTDIQSV